MLLDTVHHVIKAFSLSCRLLITDFDKDVATLSAILEPSHYIITQYNFNNYVRSVNWGRLFKLTASNVCSCCTANWRNNLIRSF